MSATHDPDRTTTAPAPLYLALEPGWTSWGLAFTTAPAMPPRRVTIPARDRGSLGREIERARRRFGLPDGAPIRSCYEAGRDGFWLPRSLAPRGVDDAIVDSSSIEVNRRARRAKSDAIDVAKLLSWLMRYHNGERDVWSVVNIPAPEEEDLRQLHRDRDRLVRERTEHTNRIKGLLANLGLDVIVDGRLLERGDALRQWDGVAVPAELRGRIAREFERWRRVDSQLGDLGNRRRREVRDDGVAHVEPVRRLLDLKGVGPVTARTLVREVFGWRAIQSRRELASPVGPDPTPYRSGEAHRERGISEAGDRRVRWTMVELAWMWLRHQPNSALSRWYRRRFGEGHARSRKVGIVALARELLIALWKYLEHGEVPEGAAKVPWKKKLNGRLPAASRPA